ncbi:hypothetical protein N7478_000774 [Penicillium angulare]|uniref:uncharacterized protein n=1 Tax=Penicillium angulare TaxID=116970 RepID=UPI002541D47E|nr:uncharacterized protein N7478_000774 [Penicillium angulare]KAJ5291523.1 hypothetical protein N7478_000774 [Penicillium angulare]
MSGQSSTRKLMRQKQCRRRINVMKKAYEYSKLCNADVCMGIRMRETGQVHILSADPSGFWAFLTTQLSAYYPTPNMVNDRDFNKGGKETTINSVH